MMLRIILTLISLLFLSTVTAVAVEAVEVKGKQTLTTMGRSPGESVPLVVIYTLSTCSHCRDAKEYLDQNKIPYVNREVDTDDEHMAQLMKIFDLMGVPEGKRGVPLFVIADRIRIQGFSSEKLQKALEEVKTHSK